MSTIVVELNSSSAIALEVANQYPLAAVATSGHQVATRKLPVTLTFYCTKQFPPSKNDSLLHSLYDTTMARRRDSKCL